MAIYELGEDGLTKLPQTTFAASRILERNDLQRLLKNQIDVIAPGVMVIAEEFGQWEDSKRRIDLLGIDKDANLVVIELKRTESGGHMDLQAIRYAAMVSALTFDEVVDTFNRYLSDNGREEDARSLILSHLDLDEPDEEQFAQDVRVVLASAEFSKEITTTLLWLNARGLDIRCVRLKPYKDQGRLLVDVQQIIPLPEAEEYQVKLRNKERREQVARSQSRDFTKYDIQLRDTVLTGLAKRRAIQAMVKYLCDHGVDPEKIRALIDWRKDMFRDAPGTLNSAEMEEALAKQLLAEGNKPDTYRYFTGDDELIHAAGRTYALTKMWGLRTAEVLQILVEQFGDQGISFAESD